MSGWWDHATPEQKLAQIDAAIELGVSTRVCAMNCGTTYNAIRSFAQKHRRQFPLDVAGRRVGNGIRFDGDRWSNGNHAPSVISAKAAYLAGEPVNFWWCK